MILFDSTNILHIAYRPGRQKVSLLSLDCFMASCLEAQQGTSKGSAMLSERCSAVPMAIDTLKIFETVETQVAIQYLFLKTPGTADCGSGYSKDLIQPPAKLVKNLG